MKQQHAFQAEEGRLLELMIHSVYTNKEIFLRELISNASDAIDKLLYLGLTDDQVTLTRQQAEIRLTLDKENRTLTVSDNGVGMSEQELIAQLGSIAASGSSRFRQSLGADEKPPEELIGRFGVGFYSAFMVSDRVTVISRRYDEQDAHRWESDGKNGFTVEPATRDRPGTDVVLHIRPDGQEKDEFDRYLREYTIYELVKKYSDYIRFPIRMRMPHPSLKPGSTKENPEFEEVFEQETFNTMIPIWRRPKGELKRKDYDAFYQLHYGEKTPPCKVLTVSVEGSICYRALLFIPGAPPQGYRTDDFRPGLELYCAGVRVLECCEALLPEEFRFVRGIVETPELNLNLSRELLQQDPRVQKIAENLAKKIRATLDKMLREDRKGYEKLWQFFGLDLKIAALDNYAAKKEQLQALLLFASSRGVGWVTLAEYAARMPQTQKYLYYAVGPSVTQLERMPQTERLREAGFEILYCLDRTDQLVMQMFGSYEKKPFRSCADGELGLEEAAAKPDQAMQETLDFVRDCLGERVSEVVASARLKNHPVCLSAGKGISFDMERYFTATQPQMKMKAKRILELNTRHPAVQALSRARTADPQRAKKYATILYHQALMIAGLPIEDPSGYTDLLCSLWE